MSLLPLHLDKTRNDRTSFQAMIGKCIMQGFYYYIWLVIQVIKFNSRTEAGLNTQIMELQKCLSNDQSDS